MEMFCENGRMDGRGKRAFLGLLSAFVFETNTVSFLTQKRKIGDVLICENVEC
jgi:hypothetical protein